jgi:hypothetical protein
MENEARSTKDKLENVRRSAGKQRPVETEQGRRNGNDVTASNGDSIRQPMEAKNQWGKTGKSGKCLLERLSAGAVVVNVPQKTSNV